MAEYDAKNSPEERLKAAEARICEMELDLQAAYTQLNQVRTSFPYRLQYWLFSASPDQRRQKIRELAARFLRKTRLDGPLSLVARPFRPLTKFFFEKPTAIETDDGQPRSYDVICLPDVANSVELSALRAWISQLADCRHRVFYAALAKRPSRHARLELMRPNVFETILPVRRTPDLPPKPLTDFETARIVSEIERLRNESGIAVAAIELQSPFWKPVAERLEKRFGWPIVETDGQHFDTAVRHYFAPASIIIVTYNNLALTQQCLKSIFERTDYPNYEVIVVDNASHDGTPAWLTAVAKTEPRLHVICNEENRGYSGANNQGLKIAQGDFLCLLNNDTIVTQGWLSTLIGHLRELPGAGIIGPVSNMVGNAAKIPVGYAEVADMPRWAADYCRRHAGHVMQLDTLGFFCVVMHREIYETIGPMDERFGLGYFEDADYCRRVSAAGFGLYVARDAFVHHWQGASFRLLGEEGRTIFHHNKHVFDAKWSDENMVDICIRQ